MAKVAIKNPNEALEIAELIGDIFKQIRGLCADIDEDGDCIIETVHLESPAYTLSFFVNENGMDLNLPLNFKMKTNNPFYPVQDILGTAVFFRGHIDEDDLVFDDLTEQDIKKIKNLLGDNTQKETKDKQLIKVNLPFDENDYETGVGEGIWVSVSDEVKQKSDADVEDGALYTGIAENDSLYYRDIFCGDTVLFKLRGENRAVADMDFLTDKGRITDKQRVLCKLVTALQSGNVEAAETLIDVLVKKYGGYEQGELRAARLLCETRH